MEILVYLCICILFNLVGMPKLLEDLNFLSQENVVHSSRGTWHKYWHIPQETRPIQAKVTEHSGIQTPLSSCWPQVLSWTPFTKKGVNRSPVKHIKNEKYLIW